MNEQIKDGGPAFPTGERYDPQDGRIQQYMVEGMSLRDYFAAAALQGMIANPTIQPANRDVLSEVQIAMGAYVLADAMLKAREQ